MTSSGPLRDVRVIEFAGLGPAPFCGMLLSDLGADVLRIDRPGGNDLVGSDIPVRFNILARGRRSVAVDLKNAVAREAVLNVLQSADALIEGYRPGVMERLGLGPAECLARNPKLVYGRVTGWGQTGPLAQVAGHDLNYISLSGAAHTIGVAEKPVPPLNLVGDFGGGALYLALGVLSAVINARVTGEGQVVDCAMSDGAASLMASVYAVRAAGAWTDQRQSNHIDGGAHFYDTYQCADGKWISVAALEPKFYAVLCERTGLSDLGLQAHATPSQWRSMRARLAEIIAGRTQEEWCRIMHDCDACFAPVLNLEEAPRHPHNVARGTFVDLDGVIQPGPVPKFSRTPGAIQGPPPAIGEHGLEALREWGIAESIIGQLVGAG